MDIIVYDFETYYSPDYTLKTMSVEEYVLDSRFQAILLGVKVNADPARVVEYPHALEEARRLRQAYPDALWVAHNAMFDATILAAQGHVDPYRLTCTQLMSRFLGLHNYIGLSLRELSQTLGLGQKGDYLLNSISKRYEDFNADELADFKRYCAQDVELTSQLFATLRPGVTQEAMNFIDLSIKFYAQPCLELDKGLLETYKQECLAKQEADRQRLERRFAFDSTEEFLKALRSKDKFVAMLTELGAEIPMKHSAAQEIRVQTAKELLATASDPKTIARCQAAIAKGPTIPALAKTDEEFINLMSAEDEDIALLARLRAENNSSIALSRAESFLAIARRSKYLRVPLLPWGAHTGRYAAGRGDKINLQNLPKHGDSTLRRAIKAPQGMKIVAGDSAQIEARVGAWVAGQTDLVELFRRDEDPYVDMAAAISGEPAETILHGAKVAKDPKYMELRQIGKITILSSQYGIGPNKFATYLTRAGICLGENKESHLEQAKKINYLYNNKNAYIKNYRNYCQDILDWMAGSRGVRRLEPLGLTCHAGADAMIVLPSGFRLLYPGLTAEIDENGRRELRYKTKEKGREVKKYIYGGLLFNNIVQGLSFDILRTQGLNIEALYTVVSNIHDSWVTVVLDARVEDAKDWILQCLLTPPSWAKDLPLGAEVSVSDTYEVA
jgi:DNA polymerase